MRRPTSTSAACSRPACIRSTARRSIATGRLYVTQSGGRETKVPVPLYRVGRDGAREPLAVEIANPTSLAVGPDGAIYVSSRFERSRLSPRRRTIARRSTRRISACRRASRSIPTARCSSAIDPGSILQSVARSRQVETYATLPASVAAFHLAFGPDDALYRHGADARHARSDLPHHARSARRRRSATASAGRRGWRSTRRARSTSSMRSPARRACIAWTCAQPQPELVLSAPALVGVAFDPLGGLVLASSDTIWRLDV